MLFISAQDPALHASTLRRVSRTAFVSLQMDPTLVPDLVEDARLMMTQGHCYAHLQLSYAMYCAMTSAAVLRSWKIVNFFYFIQSHNETNP